MAAVPVSRLLSQRLSSIAHSCIADPFRPNMQLATFLNSFEAYPRLTPRAVNAARSLYANELAMKVYRFKFSYVPVLQLTIISVPSIRFRTKCYIPRQRFTIMIALLRRSKKVLEESDDPGGKSSLTSGSNSLSSMRHRSTSWSVNECLEF